MSAAAATIATPGRRRARRITLDVVAHEISPLERRVVLRAGQGELIARFDEDGALALTAIDRVVGAAFVDAIARWLGMPLAAAAKRGERIPAATLTGSFACSCDAHILELFIGDTEALLHLDSELARAALAEKWATRRAQLLRALDRAIGLHRDLEERTPVVVAGLARISVPRGWLVDRLRGRASDPSGQVVVAIAREAPMPDDARPAAIRDRGDLVYTVHAQGTRRTAIAVDDGGREVIVIYDFAPDAAPWALTEWERILSTLELG